MATKSKTDIKEPTPVKRPYEKPKRKKGFASEFANQNVMEKYVEESTNYEGVYKMKGVDPALNLKWQDANIFRTNSGYLTIDQYCHLIYGWLMLNPQMLSVHDFYMYPKDNAPFLYTLEQVIEYDSDEIYNLLQERIKVNMLRGKIPRESALAVLRECYGWERPDNNLNVNFQSEIGFRFGGAIPTDNNDNTSEESK